MTETPLQPRNPEEAAHTEQRVVDLQRSVAEQAAQGALEAVAQERQRLQAGTVKDTASSARNLATVAGIAVDKILSLTGRPQTVIEHRTVDDSLDRLKRLGLVVDGTAVELANTAKAALPAAQDQKPKAVAVPASG